MARHKLSAAQVKNLGKGKHGDGGGLYIVKRDRTQGKWVFRYKTNGRSHDMGLGAWPDVSLSEAREKAEWARGVRREGRDPLVERERQRRHEIHTRQSLVEIAEDCFLAKKAELKGDGRAGRWDSPLRIHVLPKIGQVPVTEIDAPLIREVISPIWHTKSDTARKAIDRLGQVLTHAAALGLNVDLQAIAKAKALLGKSRHEAKHIEAMDWRDVPEFYKSLTDPTSCQLALKFLILTGVRSAPVRFASFNQIIGDLWTIPADLMKGRKGKVAEFRVPLSSAALSVLEDAKQHASEGLVFPGSKPGRPMSDMTMSKYMRDHAYEARPHGFRSSFREWADENGFRSEVAETALSHSVGTNVSRAYLRTDFLHERRELMESWAQFVSA